MAQEVTNFARFYALFLSLIHIFIDNLTDFLIGKAHAYDDTDFRKEAVGLVGEMEVVKRTIELGLPLWDEDRMVVLSMIEEQGK